MGQSMVAITDADCTGCDLCIPHCPFEALLPLATNPPERKHKKRPVVVIASQCVGCLSCMMPPISLTSPLLTTSDDPETEQIRRWGKKGLGWA